MALHSRRRWLTLSALVAALVLTACGTAKPAEVPKTEAPKPAAEAPKPAPVNPVLVADVVRGSANLTKEDLAAKSCVLNSRYLHNEQVVWRVRVIDPATGKGMDDQALDSVVIKLPDGQTFKAKYAPHPKDKPADYFWATSWTIPENYPSGTVNYTVTATTKDGRSGTFSPFNVAPSLLTVMDGAIPVQVKK